MKLLRLTPAFGIYGAELVADWTEEATGSTTITCNIASASAEGINYNLDKTINLSVADAIATGTPYTSDFTYNCNVASALAEGINYNLDRTINLSVADAVAAGTPYTSDFTYNCNVANAVATGQSYNLDRTINLSAVNVVAVGIPCILDSTYNCSVGVALAEGTITYCDLNLYLLPGNSLAEGIGCDINIIRLEYYPAYKFICTPEGKGFKLSSEPRNNLFTSENRSLISTVGIKYKLFNPTKSESHFIRN